MDTCLERSTDAATAMLPSSLLTEDERVKEETLGSKTETNNVENVPGSQALLLSAIQGSADESAATASGVSTENECILNMNQDNTDKIRENLDEPNCQVICCNCSRKLDKNLDSTKMLHDVVTCQIFLLQSNELTPESVKIRDVLRALCHSKNCDNDTTNASLFNTNGSVICSKCLDILVRLYNLYSEFLSISILSGSLLASEVFAKAKILQNVSESAGDKPFDTTLSVAVRNHFIKRKLNRMSYKKIKNKANHKNNLKDGKLRRQSVKLTTVMTNISSTLMKDSQLKSSSSFEKKFAEAKSPGQGQRGTAQKELAATSEVSSPTIVSDETVSDTCNRCGKRFKTFGGLKIHYASHLRDDNKIACKECGKRFRKPEALELHEKIDHKGFKPYKCPHDGCERNFRLKDKLKLHIKVMHEKNKPFPCSKCEKAFRTRYHLKAHDVAQHIQGDSTIGCSQCRRKFPTKDALEIHMSFHDEEKRFTCGKCNKGFKTASRLRLHAKSHDTLPSAVCPTCGKAYKHVRDLRLHEVSHEEEGSYRFACGNCPRKFYRIDLLRVHQANEKHFSQEIIGPCVTKSSDVTLKVFKKKQKKGNISPVCEENSYSENKSDSDSYRSTTSKTNRKLIQKTKGDPKKKEDIYYDCLNTPSIFPSVVPVDNIEFASTNLEMVDPTSSLTNSVIANSFRRNIHDISDQSTFIFSKDPVLSNLESTNSGLSIPIAHASPFSLPIQTTDNGDTIYTIKDSSDRSISSFSITTGAEQIGYDVINAFINNLN